MRALARAVECHDRLGRKADKLSVMLGLEYLSLLPTGEDTGGQDQIAAMTTDTAGRVVESMGRFNDLPADQGEYIALSKRHEAKKLMRKCRHRDLRSSDFPGCTSVKFSQVAGN
jgi:hypothetical protein